MECSLSESGYEPEDEADEGSRSMGHVVVTDMYRHSRKRRDFMVRSVNDYENERPPDEQTDIRVVSQANYEPEVVRSSGHHHLTSKYVQTRANILLLQSCWVC